MSASDPEIQVRACRACGEKYAYPVRKSPATRFHCATCALLPDGVRQTFERMNKRIRELERRAATPPRPVAAPRDAI